MTTPPVLYSFRRCPYAMRARLALAHKGIEIELREIVLKNKPAEMLAVSPKATVPVLVMAGGQVIDESLDIFMWACGEGVFSDVEQALIARNDTEFKTNLDRYKYHARDEQLDKSQCEYRDRALKVLVALDQCLLACGSIKPELEYAIFPFIRQFRGVDETWFDAVQFSVLHERLQAFLNGELFKRVMKKYTPWSPLDEPILIKF